MTVSGLINRSGPYTGNGVTVVFDYEFKIYDEAHIKVIRAEGGVETTLNLGSDYTVSGVGIDAGGSIDVTVAPTASQTITNILSIPLLQGTDLQNQGAYYADTVERALDLNVLMMRQLQEQIDRSIMLPASADQSGLATLISQILVLVASYSEISAVYGIRGDISTLGPISADVTAVAAIAAAVTNVSSISTATSNVSASLADVSTCAANIVAIQGASANAGSASSSAGSAAASAVTATTKAGEASASAANALASENAVALAGVPVGMVFFSPTGAVPAGFFALEGGTFDETVHTELYAYLGTNVLPDFRDRVPRGAGTLAGVSGTTQEDAFQGFDFGDALGRTVQSQGDTATGASGTPSPTSGRTIMYAPGGLVDLFPVSDGVNGTPRTAAETRVKAYVGKFVIKAYAALTDSGTANLIAIEMAQQFMARVDAWAYTDVQKAQFATNFGLPISRYIQTADQTVTAAGALTIAHGLGTTPKALFGFLKNYTAELGYSVGDQIQVALGIGGSSTDRGAMVIADASNLYVRFGSNSGASFQIINKTSGVSSGATTANWKFFLRAFA